MEQKLWGVYNPDDEEDTFVYNKATYRLAPNKVTYFESQDVAKHAAETLGMWGVTSLNAPDEYSLKSFEDQILAAESRYLKATYEWARTLSHEFVTRSEKDQKGGLPPSGKTSEEIKALDWVSKNSERLAKAGLI